ncbi:MAG TPA: MATE family efflux transporter [Longimicrobiales bacterium]|nr:MATE family efflux transporter [Longimicrobiales bacterium]
MNDRATHGLPREVGNTLRLAGPIIASQLGQVGMNTADTIQVGPLGASALAAAGIGGAIHFFVLFIGIGVLVGMGPLVSQAFGAGRLADCRDVARQGLWLALALSIPVATTMLFGREVALLFGQQPDVAALAGAYMVALAPGVLPVMLFLALRQYLEGMGHARPSMVVSLAALGLNVLLNDVLIHGAGPVPALGVVGSGYATTIVRWFMFAALLAYTVLHRGFDPVRGAPARAWRIDRVRIGRIFRIGMPIGLQFGLEIGLFAFAAVMMGWFGPIEIAAHQVTINIASATFMVALGTSMAGSIRVGQTIGAGEPAATRHAIVATYMLAVGFMAACALAFLLAPVWLIGLYTHDPAILAVGRDLLMVAAAFQVFDGGQVAGISVLRGAGDTTVPMLLAAAGYWGIGMVCALGLGFGTALGPVGVWIGLCAGLAAVALTLLFRVRAVLWRRRPSALVEQPELGR